MNESLRIIFGNKYFYSTLFSVFLYVLAICQNDMEPKKWWMVYFILAACAALIQAVVGPGKLLFFSWLLHCVFTHPFHMLPQYDWVVRAIVSIQNMEPLALISLMTMNFYSLFKLLELYHDDRDAILEEE